MIKEPDPKRVFCFQESTLTKVLKSSGLDAEQQRSIHQFLTSEHCRGDLFYFIGDHLKDESQVEE